MTNYKSRILLAVLMAGVICSSVYGQEVIAPPDQWQLSVTPYFWAPSIKGYTKTPNGRTNVDISFNDIWDALDCAALGHIEARKEKWGLFFDAIYMNLGQSGHITFITPENVLATASARIDLTAKIFEYGGFYQVGQWCPSGDNKKTIKLDALAGGRYWSIEQDTHIDSTHVNSTTDWTDPFIGVRITAPLTDWFLLHARADVGGFSISSRASEQTWNVIVGPVIKLSDRIDLTAGYRWLNIIREPTSSSKANITFEGPIAGLIIRL
jgi:hypothetical protein